MSKWIIRVGAALALLSFVFLLQGIAAGLTQRHTQVPYEQSKMVGAVAFALLIAGWILRRRGL